MHLMLPLRFLRAVLIKPIVDFVCREWEARAHFRQHQKLVALNQVRLVFKVDPERFRNQLLASIPVRQRTSSWCPKAYASWLKLKLEAPQLALKDRFIPDSIP